MLEYLGFKTTSELFGWVVKSLTGGAFSSAGGEVFGWIVNGVLGLGGPSEADIMNELDQVESDMQKLIGEVSDLEAMVAKSAKILVFEGEWNADVEKITTPVQAIETYYDDLAYLKADDTTTANQIIDEVLQGGSGLPSVATAMDTIHQWVMPQGGGVDPLNPGLYSLWVQANAARSIDNWDGPDLSPHSPFISSCQSVLGYFAYLIGIQIKGINLMVEAYHGQQNDNKAQDVITEYTAKLQAQAEHYLDLVEGFATNYFVGQQALGMLTCATSESLNVVRAADLFCSQALASNHLTVRIWYGSNGGLFTFSTGYMPTKVDELPPLTLAATAGETTLDATPTLNATQPIYTARDREAYGEALGANGSYSDSDLSNSYGRWSIARYQFDVPAEVVAEGGCATYELQSFPDSPHFNTVLSPIPTSEAFIEDQPVLYVDRENPPHEVELNLTMTATSFAYGQPS